MNPAYLRLRAQMPCFVDLKRLFSRMSSQPLVERNIGEPDVEPAFTEQDFTE